MRLLHVLVSTCFTQFYSVEGEPIPGMSACYIDEMCTPDDSGPGPNVDRTRRNYVSCDFDSLLSVPTISLYHYINGVLSTETLWPPAPGPL